MNTNYSELLNSIGLGDLDPGFLFLGIFVLLLVLLIVMIVLSLRQKREIKKLQTRMKLLMSGSDAASLEDEIHALVKDNRELKDTVAGNISDIEALYKGLRTAYQKTGLIKYDAFQQMGGQLSFCLAMLDQDNNGFIMNSVHSTEGCYCYTKEVKNGVSELSLGTEEEEALSLAMGETRE